MVRLTPMEPSDYGPFMDNLLREYAADHVRAGTWSEQEGPTRAREEVGKLLPNGLSSAGHLFFSIRAGAPEEKVGALWLAIEPRGAFVYDLLVFEPHRRRGYAEAAMKEAEAVAVQKGARKLLLHVFGENTGARRLYAKLGYSETNVLMAKSL